MRILSPSYLASSLPLLASLFLSWATPVWAGPADLYYERSVAVAAQTRCRLFEPRLAAALSAATLQARGAALRSGVETSELAETSARARARVAALSCQDADLQLMATRVRAGFEGWSRAARISFPGTNSLWRGDRFRSDGEKWRLVQQGTVGRFPVMLGLKGPNPLQTDLAAVVSFAGGKRPYAARIVMRNAQIMPRPYLAGEGIPAETGRQAFFATGVQSAASVLLPEGQRQGEVWSFPVAATEALARLDPRENIRVEFLFRDNSVAVAGFEVGDFAAGRAFLAMGPL